MDNSKLSKEDQALAEKTLKAEKELSQKEETALTINDPQHLKDIGGLGMSHVDAEDIRPAQIILVQKTSDLSTLQDSEGKEPKIGQFYHTGKRLIMDSFNCNFVFAAKGQYVSRYQENNVTLDKYTALGVMEDRSLFGMTFRSSSLYALSPLFQAASPDYPKEYPLFLFNCQVETKLIEGKKGSWYIPVIRVGKWVDDSERFDYLYQLAKKFEQQAEAVVSQLDEEEPHGE